MSMETKSRNEKVNEQVKEDTTLKERVRKKNNQTIQSSGQVGMLLFIIFLLFLGNQLLMATFKF